MLLEKQETSTGELLWVRDGRLYKPPMLDVTNMRGKMFKSIYYPVAVAFPCSCSCVCLGTPVLVMLFKEVDINLHVTIDSYVHFC